MAEPGNINPGLESRSHLDRQVGSHALPAPDAAMVVPDESPSHSAISQVGRDCGHSVVMIVRVVFKAGPGQDLGPAHPPVVAAAAALRVAVGDVGFKEKQYFIVRSYGHQF